MSCTRWAAVAVASFVAALAGTTTASGAAQDAARASASAPDSLRSSLTRERFYFVMPDRFQNGDPTNDLGGLSGPREVTGFDPTRKGWYHGGDLRGLIDKLDYIQGLGTTAVWLTPSFKNKPVQGLGTPFPSAGYHGYWVTDFTQIDPHLGTNAELRELIRQAHRRGMKVFFDIITNHTADVIKYRENRYAYVSKSAVPFKDATGTPFDDRDYAGGDTFPALRADLSFPLTPFIPEGEPTKYPAWLNDLTLYHNRGDSTFSGENSLYGDFVGLDDLFTEHPAVVRGMTEIYRTWIEDYGIDGYRIDTMKHVNLEFWQRFLPALNQTAKASGTPRFFAFGEVADLSIPLLSRFTTAGRAQAVLDFPFQARARAFAGQNAAPSAMADLFAKDDWYTDADSNAYQLPTFLGNHDMGRIGMFLRDDTGGAPEAELLQRDTLAHALLFLSRGNPVIYYGDEQGFTGAGNDQAVRQDMFPSLDSEYDNIDNDAPNPNGSSTNDGGKNDNIGSDVTPAADNFDPTHPLYRTITDLARLTQKHHALRDGAQQLRLAADEPGLLAFSRTDARAQVEYLVVLNNAEVEKTAQIPTYSRYMRFYRLYGSGPGVKRTGGDTTLELTVPALSAVVYKARHRMAGSRRAPDVDLSAPALLTGRPEIAATVDGTSLFQVTFAVRAPGGGGWTRLGTDDNAPYRVFPDLTAYAPGTRLELRVLAKDNRGHVSSDTTTATVASPPVGGAETAIVHYRRPAGDYASWGLHLWGDSIAEGVGTTWDAPRAPTRFDSFGAVFEIPLRDVAASLNFIIHTPSGNDVPTSREPGGDRSFVPQEAREVWVVAGDPSIHTTEP